MEELRSRTVSVMLSPEPGNPGSMSRSEPIERAGNAFFLGSSGFLVDVRSTPAPLCSFCGTGIDHCALA